MNRYIEKYAIYTVYAVFILFSVILVIGIGIGICQRSWDIVNALGAVLGGIGAAFGLPAIAFQITAGKKLAKAQFVSDLARDIDYHAKYESCLDTDGKLYKIGAKMDSEDKESLEKYLNFFERVKFILDTNVIDIKTIDDLLAYRFFYLVHNPNVQEHILLDKDLRPYYCSIFLLHKTWLAYREDRNSPIPRDEFKRNLL